MDLPDLETGTRLHQVEFSGGTLAIAGDNNTTAVVAGQPFRGTGQG